VSVRRAVSDAADRQLSLSPRQQSSDATIDLLDALPAGMSCVSIICVYVNIPSTSRRIAEA